MQVYVYIHIYIYCLSPIGCGMYDLCPIHYWPLKLSGIALRPRTCENFRSLCTGIRGVGKRGKPRGGGPQDELKQGNLSIFSLESEGVGCSKLSVGK